MEAVRELDYVLQALKAGAIQPNRLMEAVEAWPADGRAGFVQYLDEGGFLDRGKIPGIVPLYDLLDPADGRTPCYAMRFVAGRTLAEAVAHYHREREAGRAGRLDLIGLLDKFVALCQAVAFAHSRHVLHRDLKGQNVVLGDFGEVFLLDWGLAQQLDPVVVTDTPVQ